VVLTAAHCVDDESNGGTLATGDFRFLIGTKKRSAGGERIAAAEIREHPGYDTSDGASDVALVRLASSTTRGRTIRVAGSGDASRWQPGDPATVIGWGAEMYQGPPGPDDLKEATVPIVSDSECAMAYAVTGLFVGRPDPPTTVCAGERMGGADSCQGDSGGPLMVQDGSGAWIQVGVVSYGLGCAYPTQYGIYAEAGGDALRGWIEQNASAMSRAPAGSTSAPTGVSDAGGSPSTSSTARRAPLTLPRRLGSARAARRRGRLTIRLSTSAPVRSLVVTLRQRGPTLAALLPRACRPARAPRAARRPGDPARTGERHERAPRERLAPCVAGPVAGSAPRTRRPWGRPTPGAPLTVLGLWGRSARVRDPRRVSLSQGARWPPA
jgi:hypothetical protein